jgi:hypothetical protein
MHEPFYTLATLANPLFIRIERCRHHCTGLQPNGHRCGISAADYTEFSSKPFLCSTLSVGDYICCAESDPCPDSDPAEKWVSFEELSVDAIGI